jgi:hypothetical protein
MKMKDEAMQLLDISGEWMANELLSFYKLAGRRRWRFRELYEMMTPKRANVPLTAINLISSNAAHDHLVC